MVATPFTPIVSLLGGALIGLSAVLLMWATGRIAGISGIAARLFPPYEDRELFGGDLRQAECQTAIVQLAANKAQQGRLQFLLLRTVRADRGHECARRDEISH